MPISSSSFFSNEGLRESPLRLAILHVLFSSVLLAHMLVRDFVETPAGTEILSRPNPSRLFGPILRLITHIESDQL